MRSVAAVLTPDGSAPNAAPTSGRTLTRGGAASWISCGNCGGNPEPMKVDSGSVLKVGRLPHALEAVSLLVRSRELVRRFVDRPGVTAEECRELVEDIDAALEEESTGDSTT